MGFIYIIKNIITDKVYIGQTINTIEYRYKQHLRLALGDKAKSKLYVIMRELGIENFYVEQLIECNDSELNKYEQYYVEQYDSLNNGYNTVYPCSSNGKRPAHDYEDKVIDLYLSGKSFASIAKSVNISTQHANDIILKHNVTRDIKPKGNGGKAKAIVMYTKDFEPICTFESMLKAYEWIQSNTEFRVTKFGAYAFIDVACQNGNIAYGHRWQLQEDLQYDNKIFRTKFDKEAYINGEYAYKPINKLYYIVNNSLDKVKTVKKEAYCIDCGIKLSDYRNKRCLNCTNKAKRILNNNAINAAYICVQCNRHVTYTNAQGLCSSCYNVKAKGKSPKPSKEELQALLDRGLQKKQIAEIYGRTDSTIHYWIKQYGL